MLFVIVGKGDRPIFELEIGDGRLSNSASDLGGLTPFPKVDGSKKEDNNYLSHFVIHGSLDVVDETLWKNQQMYLKVVDRYGNQAVSSFVTNGHVKFMLLHNNKNEEAVRVFFVEVYELYIKILLNPFYQVNSPITSKVFHERVTQIAQKRLA